MKVAFLTVMVSVLSAASVRAQAGCACCSPIHAQFDFWIGSWAVYDTLGKKVGDNRIEKVEDGCLLTEHWRGSGGSTGRSFNFVEVSDSTWNQVWVDNGGNALRLKGGLTGRAMVMRGDWVAGASGRYFHRITWTPGADSSVTQLWEVIGGDGKVQSVAFKGFYRRE